MGFCIKSEPAHMLLYDTLTAFKYGNLASFLFHTKAWSYLGSEKYLDEINKFVTI